MKGKDMILCGFLLRQTYDDSNPHDIIPISFNMYMTLYENYYKIETEERYLVHNQSQTKSSRVALPEVHGTKENIRHKYITRKNRK